MLPLDTLPSNTHTFKHTRTSTRTQTQTHSPSHTHISTQTHSPSLSPYCDQYLILLSLILHSIGRSMIYQPVRTTLSAKNMIIFINCYSNYYSHRHYYFITTTITTFLYFIYLSIPPFFLFSFPP